MPESKKDPDRSEDVAIAITAGVPSYEAWEMSDKQLAKFKPQPPADEEV